MPREHFSIRSEALNGRWGLSSHPTEIKQLAMFFSNKPGVPPGINLLQKPNQK